MQKITVLLLLCVLWMPDLAVARTNIIFWHSMSGALNNTVQKIAQDFNASQTAYAITPIYKGTYSEVLTATVAAFRAHQQPDIVQIFEIGAALMMYPGGAIVPVHKIMGDDAAKSGKEELIASIDSYYSDKDGHLIAMPFNSSSALLFYNADAFVKAGLDPNSPPTTWNEVLQYSIRLQKAGFRCGFTTAWPGWTQVESFSAWHNLPVATHENGFLGTDARLTLTNEALVFHLATLADWQKSRIFEYGGRGDDSQALFTSGRCAMLFESSGALSDLAGSVAFKVGVGKLPYWPQIAASPQNTMIGGGAIWVMAGRKKEVYKGIAEFFHFLLRPEVQAKWQRDTGYLPVTYAGFKLNESQGYYNKNPGAAIAIEELLNKESTTNSKGLRLGYYPQIRDIIENALEAIWSGQESATQALTAAQERGNRLLERFHEAVN